MTKRFGKRLLVFLLALTLTGGLLATTFAAVNPDDSSSENTVQQEQSRQETNENTGEDNVDPSLVDPDLASPADPGTTDGAGFSDGENAGGDDSTTGGNEKGGGPEVPGGDGPNETELGDGNDELAGASHAASTFGISGAEGAAFTLPVSFDELDSRFAQYFPEFRLVPRQGTHTPGGAATQVDITLANNLNPTSGLSVDDAEVRVYFAIDGVAIAPYIVDERAMTSIYNYVGNTGTSSVISDGSGYYVSFPMKSIARGGMGYLNTQFSLLAGAVPPGSVVNLRAGMWYPDENNNDELTLLAASEQTATVDVLSYFEWTLSRSTTPRSVEIPVMGGTLDTPLIFAGNVNKTAASNYYASGFEMSVDFTLPEDAVNTITAANLTVQAGGATVPFTLVNNGGGAYTVSFAYTPEAEHDADGNPIWADAANWSYSISLQDLSIKTTYKENEPETAYGQKYYATFDGAGVSAKGHDADIDGNPLPLPVPQKDWEATGNVPQVELWTKAITAGHEPILDDIHLEKNVVSPSSAEVEDDDTVRYSIANINVGHNTSPALAMAGFTITDNTFHSYLHLQTVTLPAANGGFKAQTLVATLNNGGGTATLDVSGMSTGAAIDMTSAAAFYSPAQAAGLADGSMKVTGVALQFGDVDTSLRLTTPVYLDFKVVVPGAGYRTTLSNRAAVDFTHQREGYDALNYSDGVTRTVQYLGNEIPEVETAKTMENLTTGSTSVAQPGETLKYTLTLKNISKEDRELVAPYIADHLNTKFLHMASLDAIEVALPDGSALVLDGPGTEGFSYGNYTGTKNTKTFTTVAAAASSQNDTTSIFWEFTGPLDAGESIAISFTIKLKTVQQMMDDGTTWTNDGFLLNTAIYGGNHVLLEDNHTSYVPDDPAPRPYIDFTLVADIADFTVPEATETTVTYTASVLNKPNPYEGDADAYKLVLAGELPTAFRFDVSGTDGELAALFSAKLGGTALAYDSFILTGDKNAGEGLVIEYLAGGSPVYTVALTANSSGEYTHFVFAVAGDVDAGVPVLAVNDQLEFLYTATAPNTEDGFTGNGYKNPFTARTRLYVWDRVEDTSSDHIAYILQDLNQWQKKYGSATVPGMGYRYDSQDRQDLTYENDQNTAGGWDYDTGTEAALQTAVTVHGTYALPLLSLGKTHNYGSTAVVLPGNIITYTLSIHNYSVKDIDLANLALVDILPPGQEFVAVTGLTSNNGNTAGNYANTVVSEVNTTNGTRLAFGVESTVLGVALNNDRVSTGTVRLTYTARVLDNYMDEATYAGSRYDNSLNPWDGRFAVTNYFGLLFKDSAEADGYRRYTGSTPGHIATLADAMNGNYKVDAADWVANPAGEHLLFAQVNINYGRDRISPAITKTAETSEYVVTKNTTATWTVDIQNRSLATQFLKEPYLIDVLPPYFQYNTAVDAKFEGKTIVPLKVVTTEYDYHGTGEMVEVQVLVWQLPKSFAVNSGSSQLVYNTKIHIPDGSETDSRYYGERENTAFLVPTSGSQQEIFYPNEALAVADKNSYDIVATLARLFNLDFADLNLPFTADELDTGVKAVYNSAAVGVWGSFRYGRSKYVTQEDLAAIPAGSIAATNSMITAKQGESFNFLLRFQNDSRNPNQIGGGVTEYSMQDIVFIDRLPAVGDYSLTGKRNSEFTPELVLDAAGIPAITAYRFKVDKEGEEVPGTRMLVAHSDYTVEYMTESFTDIPRGGMAEGDYNRAGPPAAANWLDEADIGSVYEAEDITGLRVIFDSSVELENLEGIEVVLPMRVPADKIVFDTITDDDGYPIPNAYTAWNTHTVGFFLKDHLSVEHGNNPLDGDIIRLEGGKAGVRVEDPSNATITLSKELLDEDGRPLPLTGKAFGVRITGTKGYNENVVLDATNGFKVTLENLPLDTYTIRELYDENNSLITNLYDVSMTDISSPGSPVALPPVGTEGNAYELVINTLPTQNTSVRITNQRSLATLDITKHVNGEAGTGAAGYQFFLVNADGTLVDSNTTGEDGKLSFTGLGWGTYTLVELVHASSTVPSGFAPDTKAYAGIPVPAGMAQYSRSIILPAQQVDSGRGTYTAHVDIWVDNTVHIGEVELLKTWNGGGAIPDTNDVAAFLLMPKGETDINYGVWMTQDGNTFRAKNLRAGAYTLYEYTSNRYTPEGAFTLLQVDYTLNGKNVYIWRYEADIVVTAGNTTALGVNNSYYVPPVDPPPAPSTPDPTTSTGGGGGSSSRTPGGSSSGTTGSSSGTGSSSRTGPSSSRASSSSSGSGIGPGGGTDSSSSDVGSGGGGTTTIAQPGEDRGRGNGGGSFWETLTDTNTPLGNLTLGASWSLLNLICSVLALFISILLIITSVVRKRWNQEEETEENADLAAADEGETAADATDAQKAAKKRSFVFKLLTIIAGILTPLLFLILEDLTYPKVWINHWTLVVVPVFLIHLGLLLVYRLFAKKQREDEEDSEGESEALA